MLKLSSCVKFLSNRFSGIFSQESIKNLVANDSISYEAAAEAMSNITADGGVVSTESSKVEPVDFTNEQKTIITKKALQKYFENVKFEAMLDAIKQDDTLLATEYEEANNARTRIMAEIVSKAETNYNTLLNQLITTDGTNKELLEKLVQTKVSVDQVNL